jgi:hypothetical protein
MKPGSHMKTYVRTEKPKSRYSMIPASPIRPVSTVKVKILEFNDLKLLSIVFSHLIRLNVVCHMKAFCGFFSGCSSGVAFIVDVQIAFVTQEHRNSVVERLKGDSITIRVVGDANENALYRGSKRCISDFADTDANSAHC